RFGFLPTSAMRSHAGKRAAGASVSILFIINTEGLDKFLLTGAIIKYRVGTCLRIMKGAAARDFGCGQGGKARTSPQRAVMAEPTLATDKSPAARRVFAEKAVWLAQSKIRKVPAWRDPSSRLAIQPFPRKQHPSAFSDRLAAKGGRFLTRSFDINRAPFA